MPFLGLSPPPENIFSGYFQGYFKKKSGKFEMI
jgi:hypothetical protein